MATYEFLQDCFAADVRAAARKADMKLYEIDALCGVAFCASTNRPDYMPTMRNYLHICAMLDLNPNDYIQEVS